MQSVSWARLTLWLCLAIAWGCGDDAPPTHVAAGDGGDEFACVDKDGDGFGQFCDPGADCDDSDPNITDECRRCRTVKAGCPCEPGTMPKKCDPPDMQVEGGTLVCKEGTRYCRDGFYSECEAIGGYGFVPNSN